MKKTPVNLALLCDPAASQFCDPLNGFAMFDQLLCSPCGPSATGGYVDTSNPNTIYIDLSECVQSTGACSNPFGMTVTVDDVPATIVAAAAVSAGLQFQVTLAAPVTDGDRVRWSYTEPDPACWESCAESQPIGDQSVYVRNTLDTKAPTLQTAEVGLIGGNTYALTFSEEIRSADFAAGWSVEINATPQTMTGSSLYQNGVLYLTTVQYVQEGDTVTISYNDAAGDITDVTGDPALNPLASIVDFAVTNNVVAGPDTERPQVTSFQVAGGTGYSTTLAVSVDAFFATDNVSNPADMEYQVNTVPATPPAPNDPNWLPYASRLNPVVVPSGGTYTLTAYVKDEAQNVSLGVGLSQQVVVVDATAPTVLDANVDAAGTTLTIDFDEDISGSSGFALTADAVGKALSAPAVSGSQVTFTCEQVYQGQICLLSYTAGDVTDLLGNPLANFSDFSTANASTVPAPAGATLEFDAIDSDDVDYEMLGVKLGTGVLSESRASSIWLKDYQGTRQEFGANEIGYEKGRVTGAVGSRVVYADDGVDPLAQLPYYVGAPQATNYFLDSNAPATQLVAGLAAIAHTCWIEGTGSATLSGGATGVATEGSPVTFTPTGDVTVTIGGSVNICQVEDSDGATPYIPTAGAPVSRAACSAVFDDANHDNASGAYYFEIDLE